MKILIALCALSISLLLPCHWSSTSPSQAKQAVLQKVTNRPVNNRVWRAANYRGLIIGKSTRLDMLQLLGEPKSVDNPPGQTLADEHPEVWYVYDNSGKFGGDLFVAVHERTNIILAIYLRPKELKREEAVKYFGPDFIVTRYAFDDCLGDEESAPLYESESGPILEVEYRHRGIAIAVDYEGRVNTISYVSKPLGTKKSQCKPVTAQAPLKK